MVRAFSLPSSGLRYFVGYALVHADRVAICSPWLSDVEVRLPLTSGVEDRHVSLSKALEAVDTDLYVYVRPGESHNEYALSKISKLANIEEIVNLHAKAVVTDEYVYVGSANITHGGLTTNRELCEILENEYGDVQTYLKRELNLNLSSK